MVRLVNTNSKETTVELPLRSFLKDKKLQKRECKINNSELKASFSEIRTPHFYITNSDVSCRGNIKIYSYAKEHNTICFCAVLYGCFVSVYEPFGYEERWSEGKANLLLLDGLNSTCFSGNKPFRMLEITLSEKYLKELTEAYPDLLKNIAKKGIRGKRFKVFQENVAFCPEIAKALNDVFRSTVDGNSAVMYIDAKIREILSLFLCQSKHKECSSCSCCSPKDNHLFIRAKDIIEKEYLNPPSLRNLALMVGTNECKLKNGFKALFGTTVYAYLFEYRMQQACRLLLGSDMTVQEVGSNIGYEYHSHFSTAFKRKFGISPMEYRMEQAKV